MSNPYWCNLLGEETKRNDLVESAPESMTLNQAVSSTPDALGIISKFITSLMSGTDSTRVTLSSSIKLPFK